MTPTRPAAAPAGFDAAHERIEQLFDEHLGRLRELADHVIAAAAEGPLTERRIEPVRETLVAWLHEDVDQVAWGYGYVAAPELVEGKPRYLFWWQRTGRDFRRLQLNFDIDDVNVYDYWHMDWYTGAEQSRGPVIHGPWVDYTGSGQYVLTAAVPILRGEEFLGIAGGDLLVGSLEMRLLPVLKSVQAEVVLVNAHRQIVVSNSPRWIPGDRLRRARTGDQVTVTAPVVPGTGWALEIPRS
jgi:hypothetical protein